MSRQLRKRKVVEAAPAEAPPISKKIKKDVPRPAAPHRRSWKKGSETVHSLSNMPLEIIYEILGYTPTDGLISLAPTTKGFRLLLMTRRSYSLWKESRQFVKGLPDCPSFLNEIAYANLCFQTFCHNCLSPNIHDVLWTLRVRTCKKCHNTLLIESDHPDFVPFWRVFYHAPFIFKPSSVRWDTGVSRIFNQSDLQTAPLTATGTTWMNWTEEQKRLSNEIKMWADACEQWHASYLQSCKDELDKIKKARLFTVIEKLRDLGWDEDLKDMAKASEEAETPHPLLDFKQVKQTRPLTDKIWSNMQDEVITFMQGWKDKRLVKARYKLLESCIGSLREAVKQFEEDLGGFCPNIRDIASFPEFREIIESPSDVTVTDLTFHALKEKLVDLVLQQRQEQKVLIHQLIERKALVCSDCKMIFKDMSEQYDDPLCHFGFNTRVIITDRTITLDTSYEDMLTLILELDPWSCDTLNVQVALIKHIIQFYGEDCTSVTADVLDANDIRLCCRSPQCHKELGTARVILSWRAAIRHFVKYHSKILESKAALKRALTTVDPVEAKQIVPLEVAAKEEKHLSGLLMVTCIKCPSNMWCGTKDEVKEHMRDHHDIDKPTETDVHINEADLVSDSTFYLLSELASRYQRSVATTKIKKRREQDHGPDLFRPSDVYVAGTLCADS